MSLKLLDLEYIKTLSETEKKTMLVMIKNPNKSKDNNLLDVDRNGMYVDEFLYEKNKSIFHEVAILSIIGKVVDGKKYLAFRNNEGKLIPLSRLARGISLSGNGNRGDLPFPTMVTELSILNVTTSIPKESFITNNDEDILVRQHVFNSIELNGLVDGTDSTLSNVLVVPVVEEVLVDIDSNQVEWLEISQFDNPEVLEGMIKDGYTSDSVCLTSLAAVILDRVL